MHNKGKQFYSWIGTSDYYNKTYYDQCINYMKSSGANVSSTVIRGFNHTFPSYFQETTATGWHEPTTCGNVDYEWPRKSPLHNCGYDLAYYMLSAMNPQRTLKERVEDHTKYGTFHAFNSTPFV